MSFDLSRRGFLRSGLLGGTAVVAGCLGDGSQASPSAPGTETTEPLSSVFVDGSDLVVELTEDHDVSGLNLIGPDGSAFAETKVPVGETTTRIQLLDIRLGLGAYEHYEPGVYELVAIGGSGSSRMEVALEPDLRITGVEQYRDGEESVDLGKLAVTVENGGTGPTWAYQITYRDAPNRLVNDPLSADPGLPRFTKPESTSDSILQPNSQITYVGDTTPLVLTDQDTQPCSLKSDLTLVVGVADGSKLEKKVSLSYGGSTKTVGLTGEYACSSVSTDLADGGNNG